MKNPLALSAVCLLLAWCGSVSAATAPIDREARLVRVGNLIYAGDMTSVCFSDRFLTTVQTDGGINTEKRMHTVRLSQADELLATPFVVMNGQNQFVLPENERKLLKRYLSGGGFLLASAGCSAEQWSASFRREMEAIFGAGCLKRLPTTHPIFSTLFDIGKASLTHGGTAVFEGIELDGRLVCLFSKEGLNDTAHTQGCCCCGGNEVGKAEQMVANALVYALVE